MIDACSIVKHPKYDATKATLSEFLQSENAAVAALVKNGGDLTLAPNGAPSRLYTEAYKIGKRLGKNPEKFAATIKAITLTESFKEWFKDSKIRDENDEPLIVWHRSNQVFLEFDLSKSNKNTTSIGYHFGTQAASEQVDIRGKLPADYPVFLNLKNPLPCTDEEQSNPIRFIQNLDWGAGEELRVTDSIDLEHTTSIVKRALNRLGYDGLLYINTEEDGGSMSYVALERDQIKSIQNTNFQDASNIFYSREFLQSEGAYGDLYASIIGTTSGTMDFDYVDKFWLSTSDEYKGLYDYIKLRRPKLIDFIKTINFIVPKSSHLGYDRDLYELFGNRPAYYDAATNSIYLNPQANFPNGDATQVIWHEMLHALTVNLLYENDKAYDYFADILSRYKTAKGIDKYAESDEVAEFVANIWTDPELIRDLKQIKGGHKDSLWNRIRRWFYKYFGFAPNDSLFIQATAALDRLLEFPILQGTATGRFNYTTAAKSLQDIVRLLLYLYNKEGLSQDIIRERLTAYLKGDEYELARASKMLDYIHLRRAELHTLGKDFGQEKITPRGYMDWEAYLHGIDLRKEIDSSTDVSVFAALTDYKVEPAEVIVPKLYKTNFKLGDLDIADIDVNYFKRVNPYYESNFADRADVLVRTHSSKYNVLFTDSFSDKNIISSRIKVTPKIEDGWRINTNGDRMYLIPLDLDYEIWVDQKGEETIVIKGKDEETVNRAFKLINSTVNLVSTLLFANNILATDDVIFKTIRSNNVKTNNTALRLLVKIPVEQRKEKLQLIYTTQKKYYQNDLANTLYNSFVKTLYMMSVRIPTQHFQSIMATKVVGLTNDEDNNVFVNRWLFWLQGSDLDIKH